MTLRNAADVAQWDDRAATEFAGRATWQTRLGNQLLRTLVRPAITVAAWIGVAIASTAPWLWRRMSLRFTGYAGEVLPPLAGTAVTSVRLPHCNAEWVVAEHVSSDSPVVVYYHGGAFMVGGLATHRRLISRISQQSGARVLSVNYRMLPRWSYGDMIADALDGYRHVLGLGIDPESVVLAGDSAGGYLAAVVGVEARNAGLTHPAGQVLLSALVDFDLDSKVTHLSHTSDVMFSARSIRSIKRLILGTETPASAADGDLAGLGPFLIQVGSAECLRGDAELLATRLDEVGVQRWLQIWDDAPHVFQAGADLLPDAKLAIQNIGSFIRWATTTGEQNAPAREA